VRKRLYPRLLYQEHRDFLGEGGHKPFSSFAQLCVAEIKFWTRINRKVENMWYIGPTLFVAGSESYVG
jgi:hypothetical protein